jgi:hypothetical protein
MFVPLVHEESVAALGARLVLLSTRGDASFGKAKGIVEGAYLYIRYAPSDLGVYMKP